jgi:Tol biopolymer transport system component
MIGGMTRKLVRTLLPLVLLAAASGLIGSTPAEAAAACPSHPLTSTAGGESGDAAIDAPGNRIVFVSDAGLGGDNPDGNREVYLHTRPGSTTTQITDTTGPGASSTRISDDGTRIVFVSAADIDGTNPDESLEIFLFDTDTSLFSAVTTTIGATNSDPDISGDGSRVTFTSTADIGGGNPDHNFEIYVRTVGGGTSQVTNTTGGGSSDPAIDGDGNRVVFRSDRNIGGGNADGNGEIFLHDTTGPTTTQVTNTTGGDGSRSPAINTAGNRVAFQSDRNIGGGNPDGSTEVFAHTPGGATTQVTDSATGTSGSPELDAAGGRIAFESSSNIGGLNPEGNFEIFLHDSTVPSTLPLTSTAAGDAFTATVSADATEIAFESEGLTPSNPEGNAEVNVALCGASQTCDGQNVTVHLSLGQVPTNGADVILGPNGADPVVALGGNDRFCGRQGADTFVGGSGNDRAFGANGNDTLLGQAGNDLLDGGPGADTLVGQTGTDTCRGQLGTDIAPTCEVRAGIP